MMLPQGTRTKLTLALFAWVVASPLIGGTPSIAAVEQCRFIKAKPEREACYARQEAALVTKRKTGASDNPGMVNEVDRLQLENDKINARIKNICKGC